MVRIIAIAALLVLGASLVSLAAVPNSKARIAAPARVVGPQLTAPAAQPSVPAAQPSQPTVQPTIDVSISQPSMMGSGPGMMPGGSVAVDSQSVYIVSSCQLWKVNKATGQLICCTALPSPQSQPAAAGAGPSVTQPNATGASAGAGPTSAGQMNMPASVAVDDSAVYVVRGSQFIRFSKDNLQLIGCSALPVPQCQPAASGAGPSGSYVCPPGSVMFQPTVCPPGSVSVMPPSSYASWCGAGPAAACPPGPIFVSSSVCPPSTINVGVGPTCVSQLTGIGKLGSCHLDQTYIRMLIQANNADIAYSQLAQQKATQPMLKEFATREIAIKCAENQQLQKWLYDWYDTQALAGLNPTGTETYNKLNCMSGSNFDVTYMQAILNTNAEVDAASRLVQQRVARPELGRVAGKVRAADARQSAQLETWLLDWYNVKVVGVPCPVCL